MAEAAHNIRISGLRLAHASPTFMEKYEVPSAGDWSIHRGGAVFIQGPEDVSSTTIQRCS